jgi:hypothetical protein
MISSTNQTFTFVLMRRLSMATTTHLPSKKHIVQLHPKKHTAHWILLSVMLIVLSSLFVIKLIAQPVATTALPAPSVPLAYDATGAMLNSVVFPTYPDRRVQSPPALYDATGAMLNAIVFSNQVRPVSPYEPRCPTMQPAPCYECDRTLQPGPPGCPEPAV